jgi:hypothetical protein
MNALAEITGDAAPFDSTIDIDTLTTIADWKADLQARIARAMLIFQLHDSSTDFQPLIEEALARRCSMRYAEQEINADERSGNGGTSAASEPKKDEWPVMDKAAYVGLVGDMVRTIAPQSEADPVSILIQGLVCAGNIIGRSAYYQVESDRHHANLFAVLTGQSSKARKGTSYGRIRAVAKIADEKWTEDRCKGGLSSGEGLINAVRDAVVKWDAKAHEWDEVDPGIADKRLMIVELNLPGRSPSWKGTATRCRP